MKLPALTTRRLIIVTAIAGFFATVVCPVLFAACVLLVHALDSGRLAEEHINKFAKLCVDLDPESDRNSARAKYHWAMFKKYDRLSSHPWLYIEPDPPEPH